MRAVGVVKTENYSFRLILTATPTRFVSSSRGLGRVSWGCLPATQTSVNRQRGSRFQLQVWISIWHFAGKSPSTSDHCLVNWEKVTTDPWVLKTFRGLHLNFVSPPVQRESPFRGRSLPDHHIDARNASKRGTIHVVRPSLETPGFVSSFLVPKKGVVRVR